MTRRRVQSGGRARMSGACALAVVPEHPRPGGGSSAIVRARAGRPGRLTRTTGQIAAARRRDAEERAERTRLEVLVHRLDVVIDACERAHLADLMDAPAEFAAQARAAITAATVVLTAAGEEVAGNVGVRVQAGVRITEVMDVVWEVQDGVLDLLIPWRRELPDDVPAESPGTPVPAAAESPASQRRAVRCERAVAEAGTLDVGTTWAELLRSAQQIWAWPVGSAERERLCTAFTGAVKQRMPRWRGGVAMPRAMPRSGVHPATVSRGCAHCGRPCESQAIDGVGYCSTEHLLLARITGVGGAGHTWRSS
jgi:hypothetical protein